MLKVAQAAHPQVRMAHRAVPASEARKWGEENGAALTPSLPDPSQWQSPPKVGKWP